MSNPMHEYLMRRIAPEQSYESLLRFPRFFEIETINGCNARCPMCTIGDWERHTPAMKDDLFARIADEISAESGAVQRVSLYRDGEPLLDKKLGPRIARLKEGGVREVAISTNAALLDEKRGRAVLEGGLDTIILSIDSLQKDVFEGIRAGLVFEEVRDNALAFIALRDRLRSPTRIWVRMIRQESNWNEWPAYEAFWRSHLGPQDRVNYHNIHNWGGQADVQLVSANLEKTLPCVALWSLMVIFADGKVPLCNVDFNNKYPAGDVSQQSIAEVWQSKLMAERRSAHLDGRKGEIPLCVNCNAWEEPPDRAAVAPVFAPELAPAS